MSVHVHPIQAVVRRTQLSAHVIRIWEKRYGAVVPQRTPTNRRLYSDEQIERLSLLRQVTGAGQSIGYVAKLPIETLRQLAPAASASAAPPAPAVIIEPSSLALLDDCLRAIRALDAAALDLALKRAETVLGLQGMLQQVAAPLAQSLGQQWRDGTLRTAHEHFASAALRTFLAQAARPFATDGSQPKLVVATPSGQVHELGALLAGALAANLGWHVTYLGTSLPAAEIAGAARQNQARAVALSLVYPMDDPGLETELARLRDLLPAEIAMVVGGQAAPAYGAVLQQMGAVQVGDLVALGAYLDRLRLLPRETLGAGAGRSTPQR